MKDDEALRHIPVILLTAKADEGDRILGLKGGADDYLTKPFSMRELEVRVTNLILSRAHLRNKYSQMLQVPLTEVVIRSGEEAFMQQVLEVMNRHLGDSNFSTDWLADEVNLSRRQVERKVKTLTKQTPPELMQRMRMERAAKILEARPGSIAEVAYAVGFKSPFLGGLPQGVRAHALRASRPLALALFSVRHGVPEREMSFSEQRLTHFPQRVGLVSYHA